MVKWHSDKGNTCFWIAYLAGGLALHWVLNSGPPCSAAFPWLVLLQLCAIFSSLLSYFWAVELRANFVWVVCAFQISCSGLRNGFCFSLLPMTAAICFPSLGQGWAKSSLVKQIKGCKSFIWVVVLVCHPQVPCCYECLIPVLMSSCKVESCSNAIDSFLMVGEFGVQVGTRG